VYRETLRVPLCVRDPRAVGVVGAVHGVFELHPHVGVVGVVVVAHQHLRLDLREIRVVSDCREDRVLDAGVRIAIHGASVVGGHAASENHEAVFLAARQPVGQDLVLVVLAVAVTFAVDRVVLGAAGVDQKNEIDTRPALRLGIQVHDRSDAARTPPCQRSDGFIRQLAGGGDGVVCVVARLPLVDIERDGGRRGCIWAVAVKGRKVQRCSVGLFVDFTTGTTRWFVGRELVGGVGGSSVAVGDPAFLTSGRAFQDVHVVPALVVVRTDRLTPYATDQFEVIAVVHVASFDAIDIAHRRAVAQVDPAELVVVAVGGFVNEAGIGRGGRREGEGQAGHGHDSYHCRSRAVDAHLHILSSLGFKVCLII
jgi:hypothetical protein